MMRQLTSPALRAGMLAGILFTLSQAVSIKNVVSNVAQAGNAGGLARYLASAVFNAEFTVQALLVVAALLIVWFIVDQVRMARFMREMRSA